MSKTIAFVQARMASSRLPGKILKSLNDLTVIEHLIIRLRQAKKVDQIVVLTSDNPENDQLCNILDSLGIDFFRGSEDDVLGRFAQANEIFAANKVVRITADSPFICPEVIDQLIAYFDSQGAQYAFLSELFSEGVDCEVIDATVLSLMAKKAQLPSEREHVTLHLFNNPTFCNIVELKNKSDDSVYRFTLDTPEDWEVVSRMAKHFGNRSTMINYQEIKTFFDTYPDIYKINNHVVRNEGLAISLKKEQVKND